MRTDNHVDLHSQDKDLKRAFREVERHADLDSDLHKLGS